MNKTENQTWHNLLTMSSPTFSGETTLPYGFVTSTMAGLRANQQMEQIERIGWRALLASLAALAVAAAVAVTVNLNDRSGDMEPGVNSLVQMENISVS